MKCVTNFPIWMSYLSNTEYHLGSLTRCLVRSSLCKVKLKISRGRKRLSLKLGREMLKIWKLSSCINSHFLPLSSSLGLTSVDTVVQPQLPSDTIQNEILFLTIQWFFPPLSSISLNLSLSCFFNNIKLPATIFLLKYQWGVNNNFNCLLIQYTDFGTRSTLVCKPVIRLSVFGLNISTSFLTCRICLISVLQSCRKNYISICMLSFH